MMPNPGAVKVPFDCMACGVDFQLYHDGTTPQNVTVVCKCGTRNRWVFQPLNRPDGVAVTYYDDLAQGLAGARPGLPNA